MSSLCLSLVLKDALEQLWVQTGYSGKRKNKEIFCYCFPIAGPQTLHMCHGSIPEEWNEQARLHLSPAGNPEGDGTILISPCISESSTEPETEQASTRYGFTNEQKLGLVSSLSLSFHICKVGIIFLLNSLFRCKD